MRVLLARFSVEVGAGGYGRQRPPLTLPNNQSLNSWKREDMAKVRADRRRHAAATGQDDGKSRRRNTWLIIATAVVSVVSLALNWLQLQSVQRAIGMPVPDLMVGGYDAAYLESVRESMDEPVIERYQAAHYLWDLIFPVAFAAFIILLVHRFGRRSPLRWLFYAVAVLYAAVDIAENIAIEVALASAEVAAFASFLTTAKFVLFAAALLAFVLSFLLIPASSRRRTDH